MMLRESVSSTDIQKARRHAKRKRASSACDRCKTAKVRCSDYRPCKHCEESGSKDTCLLNPKVAKEVGGSSEMYAMVYDSEGWRTAALRSSLRNLGDYEAFSRDEVPGLYEKTKSLITLSKSDPTPKPVLELPMIEQRTSEQLQSRLCSLQQISTGQSALSAASCFPAPPKFEQQTNEPFQSRLQPLQTGLSTPSVGPHFPFPSRQTTWTSSMAPPSFNNLPLDASYTQNPNASLLYLSALLALTSGIRTAPLLASHLPPRRLS
jgi:hypothetical protein